MELHSALRLMQAAVVSIRYHYELEAQTLESMLIESIPSPSVSPSSRRKLASTTLFSQHVSPRVSRPGSVSPSPLQSRKTMTRRREQDQIEESEETSGPPAGVPLVYVVRGLEKACELVKRSLSVNKDPSSQMLVLKSGMVATTSLAAMHKGDKKRFESDFDLFMCEAVELGMAVIDLIRAPPAASREHDHDDQFLLPHLRRVCTSLELSRPRSTSQATVVLSQKMTSLSASLQQLQKEQLVFRAPARSSPITSVEVCGNVVVNGHEDGGLAVWTFNGVQVHLVAHWNPFWDSVMCTSCSITSHPETGTSSLSILVGGRSEDIGQVNLLLDQTASLPAPARLSFHSGWVRCLARCPQNANLLASGGGDGKIALWDMDHTPADVIAMHRGHENWVMCLEWLDSSTLLSGGADYQLCQFHVDIGEGRLSLLHRFSGYHDQWITSLAKLTPLVFASSSGDCVRVWNIVQEQESENDPAEDSKPQHVLKLMSRWTHKREENVCPKVVSLCCDAASIVSVSDDGFCVRKSVVPGFSHEPFTWTVNVTTQLPQASLDRGSLCISGQFLNLYP